MNAVGIKELKNNLSRYLSHVKAGEDVIITERGKIIARIIQEKPKKASVLEALSPLVEKGVLSLPTRTINKRINPPIVVSGKRISEMIIEDRR